MEKYINDSITTTIVIPIIGKRARIANDDDDDDDNYDVKNDDTNHTLIIISLGHFFILFNQ